MVSQMAHDLLGDTIQDAQNAEPALRVSSRFQPDCLLFAVGIAIPENAVQSNGNDGVSVQRLEFTVNLTPRD